MSDVFHDVPVFRGRKVRPVSVTDVDALLPSDAPVNAGGFVGFTADEVKVLVEAGVSPGSANFCRMSAGVESLDSIIALKDTSPELVRVLADHFD